VLRYNEKLALKIKIFPELVGLKIRGKLKKVTFAMKKKYIETITEISKKRQ
jgi:hypothetical protein